MHAHLPAVAVVLALFAGAPASAEAAGARLVASFEDPAGDDTGPGTYVPPGDTGFQPGDFDLRRFEVYEDGDDLRLEVTLGAAVRRPEVTQRTNQTPLELNAGLYLQNVDVYVDTDPSPGEGFTKAIPGRRVKLGGGRTWEHAIVMTPQPGAARAVIEGAMGDAARRVLVVNRVQTRGRTLVVKIPAAALGGPPQKTWGWSVHVSGAKWERSFALTNRLRSTQEDDAFTMPVRPVREAWAFGGAPPGDAHPRVIDVLLPKGADQKQVLGGFDEGDAKVAEVPFVSVEAPPATRPSVLGAPEPKAPDLRPRSTPPAGLSVVDLADDVLSIAGPVEGLKPLQLGRVVDDKGQTVARIVVLQVLENGVVARAVDGRERVTRGARVVFGE
jgi:hypothetical protein